MVERNGLLKHEGVVQFLPSSRKSYSIKARVHEDGAGYPAKMTTHWAINYSEFRTGRADRGRNETDHGAHRRLFVDLPILSAVCEDAFTDYCHLARWATSDWRVSRRRLLPLIRAKSREHLILWGQKHTKIIENIAGRLMETDGHL
jgi:hypothetical protein